MEMNQEVNSVSNMSGSSNASNMLELSSSASASTNSDLSSPESNSALSSPPILPPPPLPLQDRQHHSISIPSVPVIPSACPPPPPYRTRYEIFRSLKESTEHWMMLTKLQKSDRGYQKEVSSHKKAVRRLSKDLYVIVSMYALVQGAIFAAVAQSTIFTCEDWWGPAGIVGMVTFGTLIAALDKLRRMGCQKQEVKRFERRQSAVFDKIALLLQRGSLCEIESLEPEHFDTFPDGPGTLCIFSAHGLLVLGFLLGFSALMMVSFMRMLVCPPCRC